MLLADRPRRLIYFCLMGMEIAWIAPFLLLIYRPLRAWSPLTVFIAFFLLLLLWLLLIDLLDRFIQTSPQFELAVATLIGLTSFAFIRLFVYPDRALFDLSWIFHAARSVVRFEVGFPPELVIVLLNLFVWLRATNASSREIDFWNVGLSFRVGMLMLIVGGGLLHQFSGINGLVFVWLYFTFGLTAVALTRIDEKASDMRSSGRVLPPARLAQLLLIIGLTMLVIVWLSAYFNPETLRAAARWMLPLWLLVGRLLLFIATLLFILIAPILMWIGRMLARAINGIDLSGLSQALDSFRDALNAAAERNQDPPFSLVVPDWVWLFLRYLGVTVALLLCLALVMLFLGRIRRRRAQEQAEAEGREAVTFGGESLKEGWAWLKDTARLFRRYGLSRHLLAAISVENMYANVCRLARHQGFPRPPAQPPDDYLPTLQQVFQGQDAPLSRLTTSYMRVHYGRRALSRTELEQTRDDYNQVRRAEREER